MKIASLLACALLAFALAAQDADAAGRRFGGGGNIGRQRAVPMQQAPAPAPAVTPAKPAPSAAPAPSTPPTPAPQPSFMSRWGGMLAGLGIGALLGSLFGGHLGGLGGILALVLAVGLGFLLLRTLASRRTPETAPAYGGEPRPRFAGIGSAIAPAGEPQAATAPRTAAPALPPDVDPEAFLRVAKTSFIRLQAANDARDLEDIRDYTTPEMYAEIAMQMRERGDVPQRTEVTSLEASLADAAIEGDQAIASVRFTGLIREEPGAVPEAFDEIWHVRRDLRDPGRAWLVAGIQQTAPRPS